MSATAPAVKNAAASPERAKVRSSCFVGGTDVERRRSPDLSGSTSGDHVAIATLAVVHDLAVLMQVQTVHPRLSGVRQTPGGQGVRRHVRIHDRWRDRRRIDQERRQEHAHGAYTRAAPPRPCADLCQHGVTLLERSRRMPRIDQFAALAVGLVTGLSAAACPSLECCSSGTGVERLVSAGDARIKPLLQAATLAGVNSESGTGVEDDRVPHRARLTGHESAYHLGVVGRVLAAEALGGTAAQPVVIRVDGRTR